MPKETFFNLPEAKRERIVELAIEEFSENPYGQASLSKIVVRAGIAKGSIYQYFENKLDFYRWLVLEEGPRRKLEYLAFNEPHDPSDFFERAERLMLAGLDFNLDNPRLSQMMARLMEPVSDPELQGMARELRRMSADAMTGWVAEAQRAGAIRKGVDPRLAAHLASAFMGAGFVDALLDRLGVDLPTLLRDPTPARRMKAKERRKLVKETVDLLRNGLETKAGS